MKAGRGEEWKNVGLRWIDWLVLVSGEVKGEMGARVKGTGRGEMVYIGSTYI